MQWGEEQPGLSYVTGLTSNAVLKALARAAVEQAPRAYARWGRQVTRLHSTRYQAQTWARLRCVVIKVEGSEQGVNTRCVVTDMEPARTKVLDQKISCARGQAENERKDHKLSLQSDRTSCHRLEANQFRVLLHAAAYVLLEPDAARCYGPLSGPRRRWRQSSDVCSNSVLGGKSSQIGSRFPCPHRAQWRRYGGAVSPC